MVYSLSYELRSTEMDYTPMFIFLEHGIGNGGIHVLRDCWWIYSQKELDINETCDEIRKRMSEKDHFFFNKLSRKEINGWLPSSTWNWFEKNNELNNTYKK